MYSYNSTVVYINCCNSGVEEHSLLKVMLLPTDR